MTAASTARLGDLERDRFLAQAEQIAQLMQHPGWPVWVELLRTMRAASLEELAKCADPGEFRYWQGAAGALLEIIERPTQMCELAGQVQRTEEASGQLRPELRSLVGLGLDHDSDI